MMLSNLNFGYCGSHKFNLNDLNTNYFIEKMMEEMLLLTSSIILIQSYANL